MNDYNPFSLEGKTILVTGASSGIGQAIAIESSKMGADVIITGRNEERLAETLSKLAPGNHLSIAADLGAPEGYLKIAENLPKIDGLVNNAGITITQPVPFIKESTLNQIFSVNIVAPILLTQHLVKKRIIKNGGSIVFMSSLSSVAPCAPGNSLYTATKSGINGFMKNAAVDLATKKIRCNSVLPSMVETPLKEGINVTDKQWEKVRNAYPLKRLGKPEDIAYAVIYLLSDASSWVTGTELILDGGRKLR